MTGFATSPSDTEIDGLGGSAKCADNQMPRSSTSGQGRPKGLPNRRAARKSPAVESQRGSSLPWGETQRRLQLALRRCRPESSRLPVPLSPSRSTSDLSEVGLPLWRNCSIFSRYRCVENWVASLTASTATSARTAAVTASMARPRTIALYVAGVRAAALSHSNQHDPPHRPADHPKRNRGDA